MPANVFNDGGRPINSSVIKLMKWNGSTYVSRGTYASDDFSFEGDSSDTVFTDASNIPVGQEFVIGRTSGSATLQFVAATTDVPAQFDVFRWTNPDATTYKYFVLTKIGRQEKKGDEAKSPSSFYQIINPTTVKVDGTSCDLTGLSWP